MAADEAATGALSLPAFCAIVRARVGDLAVSVDDAWLGSLYAKTDGSVAALRHAVLDDMPAGRGEYWRKEALSRLTLNGALLPPLS